jgi:translation initiation factor 1
MQDKGVSDRDNTRTVYSTGTAGKCPACGWPQRNCQCSTQHRRDEPIPDRLIAKLRLERKGRGGKAVTVIYGLPQNAAFLKELSQSLKRACGTGGAVVEGGVELQGDIRDRVRDLLRQQGYRVKG